MRLVWSLVRQIASGAYHEQEMAGLGCKGEVQRVVGNRCSIRTATRD